MGFYSKLKYLVIVATLCACQPERAVVDQPFVPNQNAACLGLWRYEKVIINEVNEFTLATEDMIPGYIKSSLGGNRAELERRRRFYGEDGYYQLRWVDRGEYRLGNSGESDWQPSVGAWRWIAGTDSIVHSENQFYEQQYHVAVNGDKMILTSLRTMGQNDREPNRTIWLKGQTLLYQEHFIRVP